MISKIIGGVLKTNTKTKVWWMKLGLAIVISNIFFFMLFSGNETKATIEESVPEGWVEIQVRAEFLTTFQKGKKVLLVNRMHGKKVEGILQESSLEEGKHTLLVTDTDAPLFFHYENWEIFPYVKSLHLVSKRKEAAHEIRY